MSFHEDLNQKLNVFFNRDWFVELSEQEEEKMEELAAGLVKDFGWDTVFHAAFEYLKENCRTPESVMNFAHLYWESWWWNYPIEEPYRFMGYFYYRIGMDVEEYDSDQDILDSLSCSILTKSGYKQADLYENPYYIPERDPLMIQAVEEYINNEKNRNYQCGREEAGRG